MTIYRVEVLIDIEAEDAQEAMLTISNVMDYMLEVSNDDGAIQQCLIGADVRCRP